MRKDKRHLSVKVWTCKPILPLRGFPGGSDSKESACNDPWVPGSGRSPGEGNGNPLQYPCLENPVDRGAWQAAVHGVAESWTRLSNGHTPSLPLRRLPNPYWSMGCEWRHYTCSCPPAECSPFCFT